MIDRIPQDSFPVKKVLADVEQAWTDNFWTLLTPAKNEFLRLKVAPLLRFAANVDVAGETFTHKVERLKLQTLQGNPTPQLLQSVMEDVSLLPGRRSPGTNAVRPASNWPSPRTWPPPRRPNSLRSSPTWPRP